MTVPVTIEELDAILFEQPINLRIKLPALDADIGLDQLLEIAAETDERGPLATLQGLLLALRLRHLDDDTTTSILAAIEYLHLPGLIESVTA